MKHSAPTKHQANFAKAGNHNLGSHGEKKSASSAGAFTYGTPYQPKVESNIKRATMTYSKGHVPALHTFDPHSNKTADERYKMFKMENAAVIARNKKFTANRNRAIIDSNVYTIFNSSK